MPATTTPTLTSRPQYRSRGRTRLRRALTVLAAVAAAVAGWAAAGPLAEVQLAVRLAPGRGILHVGPLAVAAASLLAGLAGWALLATLDRLTAKARTIWTVIALIALVVSLAGPLAALTPSASAALAGLHLVVAAVLITGMRGPARRREQGTGSAAAGGQE